MSKIKEIIKNLHFWSNFASQRGASDSITDISMLSNSAGAQNISCLGLCGRDICPKSYA